LFSIAHLSSDKSKLSEKLKHSNVSYRNLKAFYMWNSEEWDGIVCAFYEILLWNNR